MRIAINEPSLGAEEIRAVSSVLRNGRLTSAQFHGGAYVQAFESAVASYVGAKYVIAMASGTAALQASLYIAGIKKGDHILVPSFTFIATANAISSLGAKPIFVDILQNYTIDPDDVAKKITKKTKAIIPVHLYGNVAPIRDIVKLAKEYDLQVIEDAAQSLGSTSRKKHTGTFSDMGCFSMYPSKVITAGEGGFVVTNNKKLHDQLLMFRNHGIGPRGPQTFGLNFRLPEISAALGTAQLKKLDKFLKMRRRNANLLTKLISDMGIILPIPPKDTNVNYSLYTVAVPDRDNILRKLYQKGIGAAAYYNMPVHKTPFFKNATRLPVTDWAALHVLSLPVHPHVSTRGIEYIAKILHEAVWEASETSWEVFAR
ncbi:MAG: DegT/DnrJ/EryC1/StrS family aminotransferase [Thaumarchaeota archaeon]|nr:DegT/DnrJ/EryC1/StrS family aminotransferase [Nitrososphaerota archaeon]